MSRTKQTVGLVVLLALCLGAAAAGSTATYPRIEGWYVTIKTNSVIAAAFFHGTFNATAGLALMAVKGGDDLTVGVTGVAGLITLLLFNLGLFVYDQQVAPGREVRCVG